MTEPFQPGMSVRLINDPGRTGVITQNIRQRGNKTMYQVQFPESKSYYPGFELEFVNEGDDNDPFELLRQGRFGRVRDLRRGLTRIQLSGRLADMVYSMEAANTDFYAYQYKPVMAMLESPSNGLLIADEVGLGKTIEAGLIWTELRARYDTRRLVVICPAMLCEKWRDEMERRFGVRARIVNAQQMLTALQQPLSEARDGEALIASIQGLRPPRNWEKDRGSTNARAQLARFLEEKTGEEPVADLLVVDEAHYLRNPESQNAELGQMMRNVADHVALLSATPINLKSNDLYQLLNLADPDSFSDANTFPMVLEANEPLQRARQAVRNPNVDAQTVIASLEEAARSPLMAGNKQIQALLEASVIAGGIHSPAERSALANRIERINPLRHVITRTRKRDVHERVVLRTPHPEFVTMTAAERDFYARVTAAVRQYAVEHDISTGFLLASPQRQVASCMPAAVRHWRNKSQAAASAEPDMVLDDFEAGGNASNSLSSLLAHIVGGVLPYVSLSELEAHDSKYNRLYELLGEFLKTYPDEKVILFSYFRNTLHYLHKRLSTSGARCTKLMGGMRSNKQQVIDQFMNDDSQVLICSEVAAEGVDLQFCRLLINYDLPWNPMRVEQRIGRLDRIGQQAEKIDIWNLGYDDTIDKRIYDRLFNRLKIFEQALGGMEAILGEQTRELTIGLLSGQLSPEEEQERIDQTAMAIENRQREEQALEAEASSLIAHGGQIMEQIHEARDFHRRITGRELAMFVHDYLKRYHQGFELSPDKTGDQRFTLRLPGSLCEDLHTFLRRHHLTGQTALASGNPIRCVFANKVNPGTGQRETISQFHPLVRFISKDLANRNDYEYPLVAVKVAIGKLSTHSTDNAPPVSSGDYVFAIQKWTFSGLRTDEVLKAVLLPLNADPDYAVQGDNAMQTLHMTRTAGENWEAPDADYALDRIEQELYACLDLLTASFNKERETWKLENEDRVTFLKETAARHRHRQLSMLNQVLEKHKQANRQSLVAATQGRIKKLKQRFEAKVSRLDTQANPTSSHDDVCYGVLRIEG